MLTIIVSISFAQQYTPMTAAGYQYKRTKTDSTMHLPSFCGVPTLRNSTAIQGALAMDTCNNKLYKWTHAAGWSEVSGAVLDTTNKFVNNVTKVNDSIIRVWKGASSTDLLIRGNATGGGTTPTLQEVTTAGATTTDKVTMVGGLGYVTNEFNVLQDGVTRLSIINSFWNDIGHIQLNWADDFNTELFNPSLIMEGEGTFSNSKIKIRNDEITLQNPNKGFISLLLPTGTSQPYCYLPITNSVAGDTIATLADVRANGGGSAGTVTNVATGYGLTGGPITSTGTLIVDTATLSTKYARLGQTQNGRFGNDTATVVMVKVHNDAGVTLTNGKVVALTTSGNNNEAPAVRLANSKGDSTSANTLGFVSGTIANQDTGWVILSGKIEKVNTSAYSNGDIIYLDTINGNFTKIKPSAPTHLVYLGVVIKSNAGNGAIFVKAQNGYELDEIHDVKITSPQNNDVLAYETSTKLWKNKAIIDTSTVYLLADFNTTNLTATNTPLSFAIGANEVRRIMINGTCTKSAATAGLKVAIGAPSGATFKGTMNASTNAISTQVYVIPTAVNTLYPTASAINIAAATEMPFRIEGIITNGSTAGTVYLQVASVTSNTATINAGTLMSWGKVKGQ